MKQLYIFSFLVLCFVSTLHTLSAANFNYTLAWRDDPATTMVIGWSGDSATVYYDVVDHGSNQGDYAFSQNVDRAVTHKGQDRKFARLIGLTPNTVYYFLIYDVNGQASQRLKFHTLSDNQDDPVSFIHGGDSRQAVEVLGIPVEDCPTAVGCRGERQEGNQLVAKIRPDFVTFNGDFVRNTLGLGVNQEWQDWLSDWQMTISSDGYMSPLAITQGNHEDNADVHNMFDIPIEEYYSLNIHNGLIRYYFLNSELNPCTYTQQLDWFENDLMNNTGGASEPVWKVAQSHVPTFAMANGYGLAQDQMNCWTDKFEQYDVRLVMESHSHTTKWTYPSVANAGKTDFERNDTSGVVYIGEGQWGAPHRPLDFPGASKKPYVRAQDVFDSFFFVRVTTEKITIESVKFENVADVTELSDDALGSELPSDISIWEPTTGSQIVIPKSGMVGVKAPIRTVHAVKFYPVPAVDNLNIQFDEVMQEVSLEVYNTFGKLILQDSFSNLKEHTLQVDPLATGVYYLYLKTPYGHVESHRFSKQ